MPELTIDGHGTHTVDAGKRLVLAIRDAGVEIGHRCGGLAKCTTCRVMFKEGEPSKITQAEKDKLEEKGLDDVRLACQISVDDAMWVIPLMTLGDQPWSDTGPEPAAEIEPEPVWLER